MCEWTILYTSDKFGNFPHITTVETNNLNAQIFCVDIKNNFAPDFAWRNPDILIRQWVQSNFHKFKKNNIAILEYDVYCNKTLPNIQIQNALYAKVINNYFPDTKWVWFSENINGGSYPLIKHGYGAYLKGFAPFAVWMTSHNAIKNWINKRYDKLYDCDIISEVRIGTIMNYNGIALSTYPMPNVFTKIDKHHKFDLTQNDIFHPIKQKIL